MTNKPTVRKTIAKEVEDIITSYQLGIQREAGIKFCPAVLGESKRQTQIVSRLIAVKVIASIREIVSGLKKEVKPGYNRESWEYESECTMWNAALDAVLEKLK